MGIKSRDKTIRFCFNNVSWDDEEGAVPGGMADLLVGPILEHLESPYELGKTPRRHAVNVYYAHRSQYQGIPYGIRDQEIGVFISHGIADKAWRDHVGRLYEHVFVSGPGWSGKMLANHCPFHRIVEVGYTKLDPIFQGRIPAPARDDRVRVVWAPTHGGGGDARAFATTPPNADSAFRSSWWDRDAIVDLLPESTFDIVEAPHPRHRRDRSGTLQEYVGADVVVADGGSTLYEAWALDLPVVFPTWVLDPRHYPSGTYEHEIYRDKIGIHVHDPADFAAAVEKAAAEGIGPVEQDFIEPILPRSYRGQSGRMHAAALDEIAQQVTANPFPPTVEMRRWRHRSGRVETAPYGSNLDRRLADSDWWTVIAAE